MKNKLESDEHCFFSCLNIMLFRILETFKTANAKIFFFQFQTENFPSEPNYAGNRQPFVQR